VGGLESIVPILAHPRSLSKWAGDLYQARPGSANSKYRGPVRETCFEEGGLKVSGCWNQNAPHIVNLWQRGLRAGDHSEPVMLLLYSVRHINLQRAFFPFHDPGPSFEGGLFRLEGRNDLPVWRGEYPSETFVFDSRPALRGMRQLPWGGLPMGPPAAFADLTARARWGAFSV
jgi:hypothetical protein